MKYSIIVPVYNCEQHLHQCIQSVLAQTYSDWELILVDDGSTDTSPKICDEYQAANPERIHVIHQPNRGVLIARRVGLHAAQGEYICFLDSDDSYDNNLLFCVQGFEVDFKADIVVYGYRKVNEHGVAFASTSPISEPTLFIDDTLHIVHEKIVRGELSNLWAQVVRRTCVDLEADYSPFEGIFKGEDLLQNLAFLDKAKSVLCIPTVLYSYFVNESGLTHRKITHSYLDSHLRVQKELVSYCSKWGVDPEPTYQLFSNVCIRVFKAFYRNSFRNPRYSRQEIFQLLEFCSSGYFLEMLHKIDIKRLPKYRYQMNLLQLGRVRTLLCVLHMMHILYIMKRAIIISSR